MEGNLRVPMATVSFRNASSDYVFGITPDGVVAFDEIQSTGRIDISQIEVLQVNAESEFIAVADSLDNVKRNKDGLKDMTSDWHKGFGKDGSGYVKVRGTSQRQKDWYVRLTIIDEKKERLATEEAVRALRDRKLKENLLSSAGDQLGGINE